MGLSREFVSNEQRKFNFKIGSTIASALAGFVVGVIVASVIWAIGFDYLNSLFAEII